MPEFDMKKMAENIWKLRERKGLSPREFANQLGIHGQRVYNWRVKISSMFPASISSGE